MMTSVVIYVSAGFLAAYTILHIAAKLDWMPSVLAAFFFSAHGFIITGIAPDELAYSLSDCYPYCGMATDYLLRKMITSSVSYIASKRGFFRIFSRKGRNDF
jgi:hypothetical protein